MEFSEQVERSYDGLRDAPREFVPPVEVKAWLNEAQQDLALRQEVLEKSSTDVVPVGGLIPLPGDLLRLQEVRFGDVNVAWPERATYWGDPLGRTRARINNNAIEFDPPAAAGTRYELDYVYAPADLVADNDVSELPLDLQRKMVYYARAQGFLRCNETEQAQYWLDEYERGLKPPPSGRNRFDVGPMEIGYEPGPFDRDPGAVHLGNPA